MLWFPCGLANVEAHRDMVAECLQLHFFYIWLFSPPMVFSFDVELIFLNFLESLSKTEQYV